VTAADDWSSSTARLHPDRSGLNETNPMATYGAEYLGRLRAAVDDFATAFDAWMKTQHKTDHFEARGLFPTVSIKKGHSESKVRELEINLAEAAGAASRAVAVTGAYIAVQGIGTIDPIANWAMMKNPRALLSPHEIRTTTASIRGRLDSMIADAEAATDSELPAFSPAQFHPVVWSAAAAHWTTHQYRVAVREAAEGLNLHWKAKLNREDANDTNFWQQTLAAGNPMPGQPKLVWPGEETSLTTKSMRGGLEPLATALNNLATGLNLTVRNVATHSRKELTEQHAMERLAAYSYLARLLDQCKIRRAG
jgi:Protein of unknown function (Hypoth_ymh)